MLLSLHHTTRYKELVVKAFCIGDRHPLPMGTLDGARRQVKCQLITILLLGNNRRDCEVLLHGIEPNMRADITSEARILFNRDSDKAVCTTREMYRDDMVLVRVYRYALE